MSDNAPTRTSVPDHSTHTGVPGPPVSNERTRTDSGQPTPWHTASALAPTDLDAFPSVPGYELLGVLGEGGMGTVYRAREVAFDRDVAVKVLQAKYPRGSSGERRFVEEARVTGQLQHPAIPPVHHICALADGRPFLAMKLIKGDTLAKLLAAGTTRARFVPAFARVCEAIAYAHSHKVIHRDLKPQNVMVGAFGEVLVLDWGLAKLLTDTSYPDGAGASVGEWTEIRPGREPDGATLAGSVLGTPAYMAPEQAAGEVAQVDERADVFGLGAMLCTILTGKPPYLGATTDAVRVQAIRGDTADAFARLVACGADPELVALCKRCLARERDDRPRNADAVAKEVVAYLAAVDERARQADLERARADERRKQRRVRVALGASLLSLTFVAATGAAVARLWQRAEAQREIAGGAKDEALRAKEDALAAQGTAERAQAAEEVARRLVELEREKLAAFEYGRAMQVAHQEWRDNNFLAMRALLDGTDRTRRGWEWDYLNNLRDEPLLVLNGHTSGIHAAAFSTDGTRIVTGSHDRKARIWDAATGACLQTLRGHKDAVEAACYSPDGARVLTGSRDQTAKVWDAKTGRELLTLTGHAHIVVAAAFSPDRSRIVTGSSDETARVWEAATGKELFAVRHTSTVYAVSFSPDGTRVLTGSWDKTAKVWDAKTGKELLTLTGHTRGLNAAAYSSDGAWIVTAGDDKTIRLWDAARGVATRTFVGHAGAVWAASFRADGTRIVSGGDDRMVKVWDVSTGAALRTLSGSSGPVTAAAYSPDGSRILASGAYPEAHVWSANSHGEANTFAHQTNHGVAAFSLDGSRVALTDGRGVRVLDAETGAELVSRTAEQGGSRVAAFSPDGARVVSGGADQVAKVWDTRTGATVCTLKGHTGWVDTACFNPDGTRVVTGGEDRTVRVWDAATGQELLSLAGHTGRVYSASFSRDGTRIVTCFGTGSGVNVGFIILWDAKTGERLLTIEQIHRFFLVASMSPDGARIVTGSWGGDVDVWDAKTGERALTLKGHISPVWAASFGPDGSRIVTGSDDQTARVWDAKSGATVLTLKGHPGEIRTASFSLDGTRILTDSGDGTAKIWDARPLRGGPPGQVK